LLFLLLFVSIYLQLLVIMYSNSPISALRMTAISRWVKVRL